MEKETPLTQTVTSLGISWEKILQIFGREIHMDLYLINNIDKERR